MSLPSCSTGVNGTTFGGFLGGGSGPIDCAELGLGNRRIPVARADPMTTRAPAPSLYFFIIEPLRILRSKDVGSSAPGERGQVLSVFSAARLGARAGRGVVARCPARQASGR